MIGIEIAWARIRRGGGGGPWLAVVATMLALVWSGHLAFALAGAASELGEGVAVTAYLTRGTAPAAAQRIADSLVADPHVRSVSVIGPDEAIARLRASAPRLAAAADDLRAADLPLAVEITPDASGAAEAIAALRAMPEVEDVIDDPVSAAAAAAWLRAASAGGLVITALALLAFVAVLRFAARATARERRDETRALRLFGADDRLTARPCALEAATRTAVALLVALVVSEAAGAAVGGWVGTMAVGLSPSASDVTLAWAAGVAGSVALAAFAGRSEAYALR